MKQDSLKIEDVIGDYMQFLEKIFININSLKIDATDYELDHIALRTTSNTSYAEIVKNICPSFGDLIKEVIVRDRKIAIIKLIDPIKYSNKNICFLEILEPAQGDNFAEGLEHAEFVVPIGIEKLKQEYPKIDFMFSYRKINPELILKFKNNANVKFHNFDIDKVLKLQELAGEL